jgi:hypothetical protein
MNNVIETFKEKKREKQITYERKMLKELSYEALKRKMNEYFDPYFQSGYLFISSFQDGCIDIAIESFLLGARYSRFGYFGETFEMVKNRCQQEEKYLIDALYDYLLHWGQIGDNDFILESLYYTCDRYVSYWWAEGFHKGEKRYRLRLH